MGRRRRGARDFVAWEGPSLIDGTPIAVIVTGLETPSDNDKTGTMAQVWILHQGMHPSEAVKTGADMAVCGACPLRGTGTGALRTCYVRVYTSPASVWRKYRRGGYAYPTPGQQQQWLAGREVRLGAYGDPAAMPYDVCNNLLQEASMHTGYTHQWPYMTTDEAALWQGILMASVETVDQVVQVQAAGWRPFLAVADVDGTELPKGAFLCPAERDDDPLQCIDCGACGGTRKGAVAVHAAFPWLPMHGFGRKNYLRLMDRRELLERV